MSVSVLPTKLVVIQQLADSFTIPFSWCGYCYRCHVQSLDLFLFRILDCHYQLLDPGQVLCAGLILPCTNFRQLSWCYAEWFLDYLIRLLPCIWITALKKLICVIMVVQYLLFFPDCPAGYWIWLTSIHSYPSQCGGWLSVMGMVASRVASSSSYSQAAFCLKSLPEVDLLASPITLNVSLITAWKAHYL